MLINLRLRNRLVIYGVALSVIPLLIVSSTTFLLSKKKSDVFNQEINTIAINDLDHIVQGVYAMCKAHQEVVQEMVNNSLNMAREVFHHSGEAELSSETVQWKIVNQFTKFVQTTQLPKIFVGGQWLGKNESMDEPSPIVDKVKEIGGGTCTIFQRMNDAGDMLRVSTNVINKDGTRAIGTFIPKTNPDGHPNPVVSQVLQGKTFRGRAYVVDRWYITAYEPIFDSSKRVIGMLYVGIPQESVKSLRQAIINTKVGKTGYVYALDSKGHYVISKNGKQDGKNILDVKDAYGGYPVREICKKALALNAGQIAQHSYYWQNPQDPNPRLKIARLVYFKDWDWIIGAGAYNDEFNQSKSHIDAIGRSNFTITIAVITVAILATLFVWRIVAGGIVRPIKKTVDFAAAMAKGDFSRKLDFVQQDEIGTLVNALNHMSDSLREMLQNIAGGVKTLTTSSNELSAVSHQMTSGSEQSADRAQNVARAADQMSSNLTNIASSSQEASANVQLVATSTKEINTTVGELAETTERGRLIADDAVNQSKLASKQVNELGSSVDQIGKVTEAITTISEQTNMLALNATIEAARAGEAGKGFAVVANEIKELAMQTSESTREIGNQIYTIQSKTGDTVGKIDQISGTIHDLNEIVNTIAAAMEKQSRVTREITENIYEAAQRIDILNSNVTDSSNASVTITQEIEDVYQSALELAGGSNQISSSAKELSNFAESLNRMAGKFQF